MNKYSAFILLFLNILSCYLSREPAYIKFYDKLCNQMTGFYSNGNVHLFFSLNSMITRNTCAIINGLAEEHCIFDIMNRIILPYQSNPHKLYVTLKDKISNITSKSIEYYIINQEIPLTDSLYVDILTPQSYGTILANNLRVDFEIKGIFVYSPNIFIDIIGISNFIVTSETSYFESTMPENIEPGTWFMTLTPKASEKSFFQTFGITSYQYIEFVLSPQEILNERIFANLDSINSTEFSISTQLIENQFCKINEFCDIKQLNKRTKICIWGSNVMDGQKQIWLQQIEYMNQTEFLFHWILSKDSLNENETNNNSNNQLKRITVEEILSTKFLYVEVSHNPLLSNPIQLEWLNEQPNDGSIPVSQIWDNNNEILFKYIIKRFYIANKIINNISPIWIRNLYILIRNYLIDISCDILVFGSNRGFSMDSLITDTARTINIPTVGELLNLFPDELIIPDVIIGPSLYSIKHHSIQSMIHSLNIQNKNYGNYGKIPNLIVISPAVNENLYKLNENRNNSINNKQSYNNQIMKSKNCLNDNNNMNNSDRCLSIGFIARLSPEKNIGIFIMSIHEILKKYSNIKFIIIGNGILKSHLIELAKRLDVLHAIEFTDWLLQHEIIQRLQTIDIIINPSLRGWSETFCIANIEVMSMSIPLITFGVGGTLIHLFIHSFLNESGFLIRNW